MTPADADPPRVVGLGYDPGGPAPVVLLKAAGRDVQPVLDAAQTAGTTIIRDPRLVDQLYRVPIDSPIGRDLYPVMAALIAHILTTGSQA